MLVIFENILILLFLSFNCCNLEVFKSKESEKVITFVEEIVEEKEELDTQALVCYVIFILMCFIY